ncbi:DNA polymerase III subunit theta [Budviciaceae bacterium BWR-B9]|uniref:DNA polymerase III subunit theta n=1 Tax=Limnobaculum allomyrinae TaxID=2791986 RepID=A0ABS1IW43_9GAMM|nr:MULTISPECIES: DNA polymerase III subunit theta [Limnobaculum]MBK5145986.1 DNA polymerase III subunit theta [Limnobaculum allomyrinae]MBV7694033.1 DNA polymerase III subunit theta [Limnobaculum sp. M2-1]
MSHNLADLPKEDREKVDVDLHASGIAYKERYGIPFNYIEIERQIPAHLKDYFKKRVEFFRGNPYQLGKLPYDPEAK